MRRKILIAVLLALSLIAFSNLEAIAQGWQRVRLNLKDVLSFGNSAGNKRITNVGNASNDPTIPDMSFGDGDSGFYETADDSLRLSLGGVAKWDWSGTELRGVVSKSVWIENVAASATNPSYAFTDDADTGMGTAGADLLSLITGGAERVRILSTGLRVTPPGAQTIAAGNTIVSDGCGTIKQITAAGAVTTSTTNTFTAPDGDNAGCVMHVINVGANAITLDANANFVSAGAADVVLGAGDTCIVASTGQSGKWYQIGDTGNN